MRLTVLWSPQAEESLATLWADGAQRRLVTEAADAIDAILHDQAEDVGESRGDGTRVLFVPPLGICFEIFVEDRQVVVWEVWRYRRRQS